MLAWMNGCRSTEQDRVNRSMTTDDRARTYDSLHMGRSSIDLYSNDVGAPFSEIGSFAAYVGALADKHQRGRGAAGIEDGARHRSGRGPGW